MLFQTELPSNSRSQIWLMRYALSCVQVMRASLNSSSLMWEAEAQVIEQLLHVHQLMEIAGASQ
jgi:hypothetical protein